MTLEDGAGSHSVPTTAPTGPGTPVTPAPVPSSPQLFNLPDVVLDEGADGFVTVTWRSRGAGGSRQDMGCATAPSPATLAGLTHHAAH